MRFYFALLEMKPDGGFVSLAQEMKGLCSLEKFSHEK